MILTKNSACFNVELKKSVEWLKLIVVSARLVDLFVKRMVIIIKGRGVNRVCQV